MHDFYTNVLIICLISISVTDWRADQMLWIETMKTQIVICQDKLVVYTHKIIWQISPLLIDLNLTQFGFFRGTKAVLLSMANLHGNRVVRGGIYVYVSIYLTGGETHNCNACRRHSLTGSHVRDGFGFLFFHSCWRSLRNSVGFQTTWISITTVSRMHSEKYVMQLFVSISAKNFINFINYFSYIFKLLAKVGNL